MILYALSQQAVHGECNEPKPWAWSVVDAAKWNSWKQLKDMPKVEAMRLYVKVLEDSVQVIHVFSTPSCDKREFLQHKASMRSMELTSGIDLPYYGQGWLLN